MTALIFASILFALTITNVNPVEINSMDDVLTIDASASGLQSNTQYLQAALTKDGETTDYLGLTKNQTGEWFQYKSSPAISDLSTYFYNFTPVGGTWSGQLSFKVDTTDSGFKGPGNYILKLMKYITSTVSYSANSFLVAINIASNSITTTNITEAPATPPSLDWDIGDDLKIGEPFNLNLKLQNFEPGVEYFIKIRGGQDENKLTKTQTKNGDIFLSDNENWTGFPLVKVDNSGKWEGVLNGIISEDKDPGKYKIRVRARKKETESFLESDLKEFSFAKIPEEIIVVATPAAVTKATEIKKIEKSTQSAVLGSSNSAIISVPEKIASLSALTKKKVVTDNSVGIGLAISGVALVLLAVLIFVRKRLTV